MAAADQEECATHDVQVCHFDISMFKVRHSFSATDHPLQSTSVKDVQQSSARGN